MMHWYMLAIRRMTDFSGRSTRQEFWRFLFIAAIQLILWRWIDRAVGTYPILFLVIALIHLVPLVSVTIRRLHDAGNSGWWLLLALTGIGVLILLVLAVNPSTTDVNRFGPMAPVATRHPAAGVPRALRGAPLPNAAEPLLTPAAPAPERDVVAEIERLARLRSDGSLSEAEYDTLKARLLAPVVAAAPTAMGPAISSSVGEGRA